MLSMTSKSLEVESCRGIEANICEDKISALHKDLLIHILLFLPTKDVVATMILSKRWRSIWKMVPRLEYKESEDNTNDERESVWWFLDKSLQQHKAPMLESLSIELDKRCPIDADVNKWIANAVDRQVRMLNLKLMWSTGAIALPTSLYTSETLVELYLCREVLLDVPSSVCLASLKKLYLGNVVYKDEVSAVRLLSRCPVLEQLSVFRSRNDNVTNFTVEVPSLKNLLYIRCKAEVDDVGNIGGSLVIDCPVLKELCIIDSTGGSCSSQDMPCLDRVYISTFWSPDEKFLKPFSSVTSLTLSMPHVMVNCCNAIYFPRLRALDISALEKDWIEPLLLLLKTSPFLKHLEITSFECFPPENIPLSWNQLNSVPKCVPSNLEVFEWHKYGGRTKEKEFATYILGNSKCLKYAEFYLSCNDLEKRKKMGEKLNSMFRVSTSNLTVHIEE